MSEMSSTVALIVPMAGALLWIGTGVWRIAKWTERQDMKMAAMETWQKSTDIRLQGIEADVTQLKIDTARLDAR